MSLSRILILAAAFGAMVWFFVLPSLDEAETRTPARGTEQAASPRSDEGDTWSAEERAVWREQVNQRMYGR